MSESDLETVFTTLKKKYGDSLILKGSDIKLVECERASTGSLSMDVETGGGLPYGRIVEFFGKESSGKTTMAMKAVASVQKAGKRAVWIDAEHSFDPAWAKLMGVDMKALNIAYPQTAEEALDVLEACLRSRGCGILVLDSLAAMQPAADLEKSMTDSERIGTRATLLTRASSRLLSALNTYSADDGYNECLIILINQLRYKVGVVYGNPEVAPGGQAIKHAAHIRIKFTRGPWIESNNEATGEKEKVGHIIRFRTEKNKTFVPCREGEFNLYVTGPSKGMIDNVVELVRYAQLYNIVTLSGRTYTHGEYKVVGKEKFATLISSDDKLLKKLRKEVLEAAKKL